MFNVTWLRYPDNACNIDRTQHFKTLEHVKTTLQRLHYRRPKNAVPKSRAGFDKEEENKKKIS